MTVSALMPVSQGPFVLVLILISLKFGDTLKKGSFNLG